MIMNFSINNSKRGFPNRQFHHAVECKFGLGNTTSHCLCLPLGLALNHVSQGSIYYLNFFIRLRVIGTLVIKISLEEFTPKNTPKLANKLDETIGCNEARHTVEFNNLTKNKLAMLLPSTVRLQGTKCVISGNLSTTVKTKSNWC